MKRLATLFILLFALYNIYGQYSPMLELDKHWRFQTYLGSPLPMVEGGFIVNIAGDTIINNFTYKKLIRHNLKGYQDCPTPPCFVPYFPYEIESSNLYLLLREDTTERKIYHLPHSTDQIKCEIDEYVMFDFSLMEGDSLSDCIVERIGFENETGYGLVDSITYGERYGKTTRLFNTYGIYPIIGLPFLSKLELMEGIGFEVHGFELLNFDELVDVCYGDFATCNILSSNDRVALNSDFQIAPNPVSTSFRIITDSKIEHLQIFDSFGKKILQSDESEVNIAHLPTGIYFLKILFLNNSIELGKVVKE